MKINTTSTTNDIRKETEKIFTISGEQFDCRNMRLVISSTIIKPVQIPVNNLTFRIDSTPLILSSGLLQKRTIIDLTLMVPVIQG